jgi:hypothetical protein
MVVATLMSDSATAVGLMAAAIAVGGFIAHVRPALSGADGQRLRVVTVTGGLFGIAASALVIVLSVFS